MAEGWVCSDCGFELWYPVAADRLRETRVALYNDTRFPGRVLLVWRRHVEHLDELSTGDLAQFWADAALIGGLLRRMTGAQRVNYSVLGNANPHLHVHIIPRQGDEPLPTRPPWSDPRPAQEFDAPALAAWREALAARLSAL